MGKISFNQGPAGEWTPLPQGAFNFLIDEVSENTSSNGNPQVILKMTVVDGPFAGKRATSFFTLTPKSAWRLRAVLEATGCTIVSRGNDAEGNEQFDADTDELMNKYVTFSVRQEEYEGKLNNKFDKPKAYAPGGATALAATAAAPAAQAAKPPGAAPAGGYPGRGATPPKAG